MRFAFRSCHWRPRFSSVLVMLLCGIGLAGTAEAGWKVQREAPSSGQGARCALYAPWKDLHDGYQAIQARLVVQSDAVLVQTESPLDTSFSDIELQVDDRPAVPIDDVLDRQTARFSRSYAALIEQFRRGRQVRVALRFWPTWPATGRHPVTFSLIGFTKAHRDLLACMKKTS